MAFQFEKLEVYQKALDWVEQVENLCESLTGKVSYSLIDQLSRAALSIPLNIAVCADSTNSSQKATHRRAKILQLLRTTRCHRKNADEFGEIG